MCVASPRQQQLPGPTQLVVITADATLRILHVVLQAKFGIPIVAQNQLEIYTTAVLLASIKPPSPPRDETWRANMNLLGELSCKAYR